MNRFALSLLIPCFATAVSVQCRADTLSTWIKRESLITNTLSAIAFGNDIFVVVGSGCYPGDVVLSSPDGSNWTQRLSLEPASLRAVTYGNGQFIAVGSEGLVLISTNGINWLIHNTGFTNTLSEIAYGRGMFVAVGGDVGRSYPFDPGNHVILTSTDGMQWTLRDAGTNGLGAVAFGNGMFVAAGAYHPPTDNVGYSHIRSSHDGISWDRASLDLHFSPSGITFGAGRFLIVGNFSRGGVQGHGAISANGIEWVRSPPIGTGVGLDGVAFGNDTFVAVGTYGYLFTSRNLTNWTTRRFEPNFSLSHNLQGVTYGQGTFVAVGSTGLIVQSANVAIPWIQPLKQFGTADVSLTIEGEIGRVYRLQASSDFIGWSDIGGVTNTTVEAGFLDLNAARFNQRFYRVISP